ncbi:helix-turn-helix domain-containing protein [Vagococcus sp. BWB3-3]|uniref:Helix-turn-helix domain-containing protein n=1 Tax=Vagococcus allomyrinae TaxID=2794353 RepID=A0A940SYL4_9ENTE|nr:Rgg/GadR/MutR family transcriptional regulator [Vagococcus allomyrinae]MBP1044591.1 helix-turn-helix domain-containing protein [Vagococcus allomyrinae]
MCYGEYFRILRNEKRMTILDVSKDIISVGQLSKFERGVNEITISKFIKLLDRINITLEEFDLLCNNYEHSNLHQLVKDIRKSYTNRDTEELLRISMEELSKWETTGNVNNRYNHIMLSIMNDELNDRHTTEDSDIELLTDYLFSIDDWTYYEIVLFGNSISAIPIQTVILLSDEIFHKTKFFQSNNKHRQMVIHVLLNANLICLMNDEIEKSYQFQQEIDNLINSETYLYEKNLLMYSEGLYLLKTNQIAEGTKKVNKALDICRELKSYKLADSYATYFDEIMASLVKPT